MRIDPDLAATVAAVVEEGTLDRAAGRLHLTPSAVSQRLSTLEERLGQRLVVRGSPARATEAGLAVIRHAKRLALLELDLGAELGGGRDDGATTRPDVAVAVPADSLATWFLEPLARFASTHAVQVELVREDQDRTVDHLREGAVVAAVTSQARAVPGCSSTPLGSLTYRAMAAPAWVQRWAPVGVSRAALVVAPRVDFDRTDTLQVRWLARLRVAAHEPPRHLVPSTRDFARAVELGLGWGMIPVRQADELAATGRLVPLGGPTVATPLHWQRWRGRSQALDDLTAEVVAAAATELATDGPARAQARS